MYASIEGNGTRDTILGGIAFGSHDVKMPGFGVSTGPV